ncbi:MAG TPA: S1 RNA-binding domain-containing protein, partial [Streptosporangiaceae bacterium]
TDERFGLPTVTDILRELEKPGRDPRPAFTTASFRDGVEELTDLVPGMMLEGVVTNVAAFGAFVDVGVHQDGLVHVSAMSRTFVSDPREVVKSGDVVRVKVLGVDVPRKRVSLTLRLDDEAGGAGAADGGGGHQGRGRGEAGSGSADGRDGRGAGPGTSGQGETGQPGRGSRGSRDSASPGRGSDQRDGQRGGRGDGGRPGGRGGADSGGAMAEALRRAGLTGK